MKVKLQVKMSWWWKSACWIAVGFAVFRTMPINMAKRLIGAASRKALIVRTEPQ